MTEETLFHKALAKANPQERAAFLDTACAGKPELRAAVEALLAAGDQPDSFLNQAAVARPAATINFAPAAVSPGTVIGPYKLLQQIGEGGFGVVYMAEQETPVRRTVALKVIKAGMDSAQVIARFESERQALAIMDHPNIAKVHDAGATESGRPYFVMELIKGVPITEFCDRNHSPLEARLKLFIDVCHAIQHAHHKGIIHRDIKPSNVMVTLHDGVPVVKVIDFGVAKATAQKLTERTLFTAYGQMIGTPAYMSPEQAELSGLDIDTRSDVFSLGVLLYELLTGTTPLESKRLREAGYAEMQRLIREEESQRPSTRLSSLGDSATVLAGNRGLDAKRLVQLLAGDLDWVAMKALEKDRNRRYGTPGSFAEDIERYLRREAILARPPSTAYRLKKFTQRNRVAVLTASLVAAALLVGISAATWQAVRATRAERNAIVERDGKEKARLAEETQRKEAETQRDRATSAEKEASEQAAVAKAVNDFLQQDLLRQADSREQADRGFAADPNLTVNEALHRAAGRIGDRFQDQPLVEAAIRQAIGEAFVGVGGGVGEIRLGMFQLERALALRKAKLGTEHHLTLSSMKSLATAYLWAGQSADALVLLEETVKLRKAMLGLHDPDTLESMRELAVSYRAVGRLTEAVAMQEETLKLAKANLGPDDSLTLGCMFELALDYKIAGRIPEAIALHEETLKLGKVKLGAHHPRVLTSMWSLASAYGAAGRFAEATALHEETVKLMKANLGPDHPNTLLSLSSLATRYQAAGKLDLALPLHEETLKLRKAKLGPEHPDTLASMNTLGKAYCDANQGEKAAATFQEFVAGRRKRSQPDDPQLAGLLAQVAFDLLKCQQHAAAEELLRECLAIREKTQPEVWATFNTKSLLGGALLGQKKYADAEPLLLAGYEGMKRREKTIPPRVSTRLPEAIERLVQLYEALDKKDDAAKWRNELEEANK